MANCDEHISVYKCTEYCTSAMGERTSTKSLFKFGYIKSTLAKAVFEYHAFICIALINNLPNKVLVPCVIDRVQWHNRRSVRCMGGCFALLLPRVSLVRFLNCLHPFFFCLHTNWTFYLNFGRVSTSHTNSLNKAKSKSCHTPDYSSLYCWFVSWWHDKQKVYGDCTENHFMLLDLEL